jgi:PleD family two-component response regulator
MRKTIFAAAPVPVVTPRGTDLFGIDFFAVPIFLQEGFSGYIRTAIEERMTLNRKLFSNVKSEQLTTERKSAEPRKKITEPKHMAAHDPLTGLYDRGYFLQKPDDANGAFRRYG